MKDGKLDQTFNHIADLLVDSYFPENTKFCRPSQTNLFTDKHIYPLPRFCMPPTDHSWLNTVERVMLQQSSTSEMQNWN